MEAETLACKSGLPAHPGLTRLDPDHCSSRTLPPFVYAPFTSAQTGVGQV